MLKYEIEKQKNEKKGVAIKMMENKNIIIDNIFNDLEYLVIAPFEFIFRKIGKITVFLLQACVCWFIYQHSVILYSHVKHLSVSAKKHK